MSVLETTFLSEYLDGSGRVVQPYEFSFTSEASDLPAFAVTTKIMQEVMGIISCTRGHGCSASSSRHVLRFTLDNNQRPPMTVKFTVPINGVPTNECWFDIVGKVMETVAKFLSEPNAGIKSPPNQKSNEKMKESPKRQLPVSPLQNHVFRAASATSTSVSKSPTPCKLHTLNDLRNALKQGVQGIIYVPVENCKELLPSLITEYPVNSDENMISCKLGLWKGAAVVTCRISEIVLMKEVPQFAKMNAFPNPPASLQNFGKGPNDESRVCQFIGIVEITMPGKFCERLKVRYADDREDEVPLFRCTLYREGSVLELLKKRASFDRAGRVEARETKQPEIAKESLEDSSRSRAARAAKRGIPDAIEVAEDVVEESRRKSSRLEPSTKHRRSAPAPASSVDSDMEAIEVPESVTVVPFAENMMSPENNRDKPNGKRRAASIGLDLSKSATKDVVKTSKQSLLPQPPGRGRRGARHHETEEGENVDQVDALKNLFHGEVFMILNSGEKCSSPTEDESESVTMLERIIRQGGGKIVELPICNPPEDLKRFTVVCKKAFNSFKYLYAIAAAIPCVSYDWIHACLDAGTLVDKQRYLLPAGIDERDAKTLWPQRPAHTRVFPIGNCKIFVAARCRDFYISWQSLLQVSGASPQPAPNDNCNPESIEEQAETLIPECNYVLVEPHESCAPSSLVVKTATESNIPLVTTKWLIRCFISGHVVPLKDSATFTWQGSS